MSIHFDSVDIDNSGNGILTGVCCVSCRDEVVARFGIATPFRLYLVDVSCPECASVFCEYDAMTDQAFVEVEPPLKRFDAELATWRELSDRRMGR